MKTAKKTSTRTKAAVKKTAKKMVRAKRPKAPAKAKSPAPKKRVIKKTVKKVVRAKKVVRRLAKPKPEETVRTARMFGHKNTMPKNPNAPARVLGKVITLSILSGIKMSFDGHTLAISIARIGGMASMVVGAALAWHVSGLVAVSSPTMQLAMVSSALPAEMSEPVLDVAAAAPLDGTVPLVVSAHAEQVAIWYQQATGTPQIAGLAEQQSTASFAYTFETSVLETRDPVTFLVSTKTSNGWKVWPSDTQYTLAAEVAQIPNEDLEPVVATSSITTTIREEAFPAIETEQVLVEDVLDTDVEALQVVTEAEPESETEPVTNLLLTAPAVVGVVTFEDTTFVFGTSSPDHSIELLALGAGIRTTLEPNSAGWWQYAAPSYTFVDTAYELYAVADNNVISPTYEFVQGSVTTPASPVELPNPNHAMLLWYLVAACTLVGVGAILLLIGHHQHHTRPNTETLA